MAMGSRARVVLGAWLVLGVGDGISAVVITMARSKTATVVRTFQGVAYALLGQGTFSGGYASFALGLAMHFAVAFAWVAVYFAGYRSLPVLRRTTARAAGIALVGAPFGAFIWLFMTCAIFPLTRIGGHPPFTSSAFLVNFVHHILVVGPLIVWLVRWPSVGLPAIADGAHG